MRVIAEPIDGVFLKATQPLVEGAQVPEPVRHDLEVVLALVQRAHHIVRPALQLLRQLEHARSQRIVRQK